MVGFVGNGRASGGGYDDDPGCPQCRARSRFLCQCGAVKVFRREGHTYLGDPAKPTGATHDRECAECERERQEMLEPFDFETLDWLDDPEFDARHAAYEQRRAQRLAEKDQAYRDAITNAGVDIGSALDHPRSEPPYGACRHCGSGLMGTESLNKGGKCSNGCDATGLAAPSNVLRGKGAR